MLERNRESIAQAISDLGFHVNEIARGLKTSRTMTVGVLIPDLENVFCTSIVAHIENMLQRAGYSSLICDYREDVALEREKLEFLAKKSVDGFIYMPLGNQEDIVARLLERSLPVILIDRPLPGLACDTVLVDNLNAAYGAIEHLINHGHRRIGIIAGPPGIYTAQERLKGYRRVHEDFDLPIADDLILEGDYSLESGYRLMGQLLQRADPPTAVFVTNYEMTLGAMIATLVFSGTGPGGSVVVPAPADGAVSTGIIWTVAVPVLAAVMDHFTSGAPLVVGQAAETEAETGEDSEIVAEIKGLLDSRIRPAVAQDGGDILFDHFDEETGVLRLRMRGACSGCPSSSATLKAGVEQMMRHYIPEVTSVEQVI